jgi:CubicO group peptidase (beta-lactamase class C family)
MKTGRLYHVASNVTLGPDRVTLNRSNARTVRLVPAVLALVIVFAATARGQDRFAGLDDYMAQAQKEWKVPGLAIAVVKDGELVLARGYGVRELGRDEPVTPETVFPIASCTKSFTTSCLAMLVDEGKVDWDDPVQRHLPDFRVADPYVTEHATIRDLACHRTGLVHGHLLGMMGLAQTEIDSRLAALPQAQPFRTKVTYNNLMFGELGEIVAKHAGLSWHDFVAQRIFQPLEMRSSFTDRAAVPADRLASRHRMYDGQLAPLRMPPTDNVAPAGAIHSTVGDMARWLTFHLREGEAGGRQLVSKAAMREMHTLQQSIPVQWKPDADVYDARFVGTGLGWYVRDYRGRKVVEHGGGWGSDMALVPEENLAVVVLSNRDWNGLVWMLIWDVIDAYVAGPEVAWSKGKKWEHWLKLGGPDAMDVAHKEQFAELTKNRKQGTHPSLPLAAYAGTYQSKLYPDLVIKIADDHLEAQFGPYTAKPSHWEDDAFLGHAPIEPFLDWLVKFDLDAERRSIRGLEIIHLGWKDPDERFVFVRRAD